MKPCDDREGGTWSCPATVTQNTPQSRCKTETFSLPHPNCSSPKYSLRLAPAHSTPHLPGCSSKPGTLHALILFAERIWEKVPLPPQGHRKRDCRIHADNFEKRWALHPYRLTGVVGAEMIFVSSLGQTRHRSSREQGLGKTMNVHSYLCLIQECEGCSSLTTNSHGTHWNCQSF